MSHFCGLVILTPEYAKSHGMDDSLAKYDENLEFPEYRKEDVSDYDKVRFLQHYNEKEIGSIVNLSRQFYSKQDAGVRGNMEAAFDKVSREEPLSMHDPEEKWNKFYRFIAFNFEAEFAKWFKNTYRKIWRSFEEQYAQNGDDWNGNNWRKDEKGVWAEYSTYNPNSKWDWYAVGNRWDNSIKTKDGEYTNICKFGEIDFEPFPEDAYEDGTNWLGKPIKKLKEGYEWHYTKNELPFCLIIDGVWYEKGDMGWWGIVSNEKGDSEWDGEVTELLSKIPEDATVYNVDFHI